MDASNLISSTTTEAPDPFGAQRKVGLELIDKAKRAFDSAVADTAKHGVDFSESIRYVNGRYEDAIEHLRSAITLSHIELAAVPGAESIAMQTSMVWKRVFWEKFKKETGDHAESCRHLFKLDSLRTKLSEEQLRKIYETALKERRE